MEFRTVRVHLKRSFRIAHGASDFKDVVIVNIGEGLGEASPVSYYGESVATISDFLQRAAPFLATEPWELENLSLALEKIAAGNRAAKAAIDIALHDMIGRRLGLPVHRLYGITPRNGIATSYTISIDTPEEMKRQVLENPGYHVYKVKVGVPGDLDMVAAVREATKARIRLDANAGWSFAEAKRKIKVLQKYDIELIEQPLHWLDYDGFRELRRIVDVPIIADEGVMRAEDIPKYYGLVDGINIKLQKAGGIREAFKMIAVARALRMQIMLGCMVETSIGISAAAQLAPLVDYVDLDGNLLLSDDPYVGVTAVDGILVYSNTPGIGVTKRT